MKANSIIINSTENVLAPWIVIRLLWFRADAFKVHFCINVCLVVLLFFIQVFTAILFHCLLVRSRYAVGLLEWLFASCREFSIRKIFHVNLVLLTCLCGPPPNRWFLNTIKQLQMLQLCCRTQTVLHCVCKKKLLHENKSQLPQIMKKKKKFVPCSPLYC